MKKIKISQLILNAGSYFYKILIEYKKKRYIDNLIKNGLKLGKDVCIVDTFFFDPSHCYLISIGDNCTICPNVRLIAHDASIKRHLGYTKFGKIDIRENCFIGDSTIILPNVTIGSNSIIGSGSVVTKSIPPNTVAAGNPAKVICSLKEYLSKIKSHIDKGKKVFTKTYLMENLDDNKRKELIEDVKDSIGFIV
jgi:maltose O-acetyltransferase